jgi:nucleotide-binding universal stress UspA family protein
MKDVRSTYCDVLVHVRPGSAAVDSGVLQAFALAKSHGARVTALICESEAAPINLDGVLIPIPASRSSDEADAVAEAAAAFVRLGSAEGVAVETITERSFAYGIGESFADYGRVKDIALLSFPKRDEIGRRFIVEGALFSSGRPIILAPERPPADFRRVVVGWDATPAAVRAIHGAMPILARADLVTLLRVSDDKEFRPGQSGVEMVRHLARHGVKADFEDAQSGGQPVADVFARVAHQRDASLVVMGAYAHSRLRDLLFGSATRDVLAGAFPVAVLLAA